MGTMRAKLQVTNVQKTTNDKGETLYEAVSFCGVSKPQYDESGLDEDNTYAKYSPDANFRITIANPALFGALSVGEKYYVDFTKAEA